MSDERAVVLGAGPVGLALVERLVADGVETRIVTRSGRAATPEGGELVAADISDSEQATRACAGADIVYSCVGLSYQGWPEKWPPMMTGMLAGAAAAGARFVFMDNCYMYGPVTVPMTEDLPLTDYGSKPATRAKLTRMWQEAHNAGRVEAASVRASDFYGPGVERAQRTGQNSPPGARDVRRQPRAAAQSPGDAQNVDIGPWPVQCRPPRTERDAVPMGVSVPGRRVEVRRPFLVGCNTLGTRHRRNSAVILHRVATRLADQPD